NAILTFAWQTDGSIKVYHGDAEDTLIGTADAVLSAGSWNHFEVHAVISSTIGEVEVKVDTITVLHLTDLNLGSTGMSSVRWGSRHTGVSTTSSSHYIDDIVCHDGSDFVGPARVLDVWPDADGSPFDWTVNGDTSGAS